MNEVDFYLEDLKSKFAKINPEEYYLSYSGGKDSHLLYWFIKEYAKIDGIEIVGSNTYMEHPDIIKRMIQNCDRILIPDMKPKEIKEQYGIPCFSKSQDYFIDSYQSAIEKGRDVAPSTLERINRTKPSYYNISKKAHNYIFGENPHRISPMCCTKLKKEPFKKYEDETGKKAILGIRTSEGLLRKTQYKGCFTKEGKFTPLHDLNNKLLNEIYAQYNIEIPEIYKHVNRTGCMGCPYGNYNLEIKTELSLMSENRRKFVMDYFGESYDALQIFKPKNTTKRWNQ